MDFLWSVRNYLSSTSKTVQLWLSINISTCISEGWRWVDSCFDLLNGIDIVLSWFRLNLRIDLTIWVPCNMHLLEGLRRTNHLLPTQAFRRCVVLSVLTWDHFNLLMIILFWLRIIYRIWWSSKASVYSILGISLSIKIQIRICVSYKTLVGISISTCHDNIGNIGDTHSTTTLGRSLNVCIVSWVILILTIWSTFVILWVLIWRERLVHVIELFHIITVNALVKHHLILLVLHLYMSLVETELLKQIQLLLLA